MLILGISTSSKYPSAAVADSGSHEKTFFRCEETGLKSHSEVLMGLIEGVLLDAGVKKTELEAIAVDVGPGSFTGVRIGVSCANAMAFSLGIPVIPVCSLAALCSDVITSSNTSAALIDCRNGNCYAAVYESGREALAPCAAITKEVLDSLPDNAVVRGDAVQSDGARAYPDARTVIEAAEKLNIPSTDYAKPMYLRPSQAERMKNLQ